MKTIEERLIQDILNTCKAGCCYMSGELFLSLAFRNELELRKIASELNIKIV